MNSEIEKYILDHSDPEGDYLYRLYRATNIHLLHGRMASGHLQGRVLKMLVRMIRPKNILEIGTFSGYSAICLAEGLEEGGMVYTFEINDEQEDFTRPWIEQSAVADKIRFIIGDAMTEAPKLGVEFDMAFVDGDKRTYIETYEMVLKILRPGGFILADNTLWDGHVIDPEYDNDHQTQGIRAFNDLIANDPKFCPRGLMKHYHVELVCTTDDPADSLEWHKMVKEDPTAEVRMLPTWRPDAGMNIEAATWKAYIEKLAKVAGVEIRNFADMVDALQKRHDFFESMGCRLSDHGIEEFYDEPYTDSQIETIFEKAMRGQQLSVIEVRQYKHAFLRICAEMDHAADWTQQYHYGAIRDNNTLMYNKLGADTGFDSIGEFTTARAMSNFLNELNVEGKLTRTILYCLNPCANEVIATMLGNFQDGSCPGKIQFGSGWWFNDQLDGMTRQMNALSVLGLLSRFVGMLTDSRSFLSYPRHEYFRRLLCNLLGNDVEKGLLPNDMESLSRMVEDISYNNARNYFKFY